MSQARQKELVSAAGDFRQNMIPLTQVLTKLKLKKSSGNPESKKRPAR